MMRMETPRYYRCVARLLQMLLFLCAGGRSAIAAQTPAPADQPACDELKRDPLPQWSDSPEHSKALTDCGYAFARQGEYARA
jgi:hypothetical protein